MEKATKVIWIHSESIRMIDAKLKVFQEYEQNVCHENILMYHDLEENKDEIFKLSGRQMLESLYEKTRSQKGKVPDQSLHLILEEAANRALTKEQIREFCESVGLHYKGDHVGKCGDRAYTCYSKSTVDIIKQNLVEETLEKTAKLLGKEICRGISEHIRPNVQKSVDEQVMNLKYSISDELMPIIGVVLHPLIVRIFQDVIEIIFAAWAYIVIFFRTINVNSLRWRWKVADEIHSVISEKIKDIINTILPYVKEICDITRDDIETVCKKIEKCKEEITLPGKEKSKYAQIMLY